MQPVEAIGGNSPYGRTDDSPDPILWVALGALAATAGVYQYLAAGAGPLSLGLVTLGAVCVTKGFRERARHRAEA